MPNVTGNCENIFKPSSPYSTTKIPTILIGLNATRGSTNRHVLIARFKKRHFYFFKLSKNRIPSENFVFYKAKLQKSKKTVGLVRNFLFRFTIFKFSIFAKDQNTYFYPAKCRNIENVVLLSSICKFRTLCSRLQSLRNCKFTKDDF